MLAGRLSHYLAVRAVGADRSANDPAETAPVGRFAGQSGGGDPIEPGQRRRAG
ncbi:hypothetical protein [Frankia sp. AgKG'84/4]|uniref:hypothetical protein n=1 Tax=Frankia sp. AgKG'84/4 TaxID=573490 RepID=UPI00200D432B|nr:hypothetical protein [Frankia sp. AgKG'84/4]MCL9796373.1 hypothetical protein [Frankia sp. AgKG'84/4]